VIELQNRTKTLPIHLVTFVLLFPHE